MIPLTIGIITYMCSVLLGIIAWRNRVHLGVWHHVAYAAALAGTAIALYGAFRWPLVLPASCLVMMPIFRGRSVPHKIIGLTGLMGYVVTLATS